MQGALVSYEAESGITSYLSWVRAQNTHRTPVILAMRNVINFSRFRRPSWLAPADSAMTKQASSNSFAHHSFAVLLLLALSLRLLYASTPDHTPLAFAERTWGMQDGLPEQVVQAFAQTSDRYLWIGTTGGLLRFDGARFVLYNRENTPAFADNNIFCLMVSRDNTLWIGTEGGGLIRYRYGGFRAFSSADGLTNSFVRTVYQDRAGQIWIGTDSGLFRISGDRLERVDDSATLPLLAVHAIYEDSLSRMALARVSSIAASTVFSNFRNRSA